MFDAMIMNRKISQFFDIKEIFPYFFHDGLQTNYGLGT